MYEMACPGRATWCGHRAHTRAACVHNPPGISKRVRARGRPRRSEGRLRRPGAPPPICVIPVSRETRVRSDGFSNSISSVRLCRARPGLVRGAERSQQQPPPQQQPQQRLRRRGGRVGERPERLPPGRRTGAAHRGTLPEQPSSYGQAVGSARHGRERSRAACQRAGSGQRICIARMISYRCGRRLSWQACLQHAGNLRLRQVGDRRDMQRRRRDRGRTGVSASSETSHGKHAPQAPKARRVHAPVQAT